MTNKTLTTLSWWGYLLCATIYVISGVRAGDWLGLSGSLLFLAATVGFLIIHTRNNKSEDTEKEDSK